MEAYTGFARVYDEFMEDIPYDEWTGYLVSLLRKRNVTETSLVELGCGTGVITRKLADLGYDVVGIDISEDMLAVAQGHKGKHKGKILYSLQDMRDFEVPFKYQAVISLCDSMNYLIEDDDMLSCLRQAREALLDGGYFIFDLKTDYFYANSLGENVFADTHEDCSYIWDNCYYQDERINEYNLTIFVKEKKELFRKFEETHLQRAYTVEEITKMAFQAGLSVEAVYNAMTESAPDSTSERVYYILKADR